MAGLIGLDFETYSATDLRTHGLRRYVEDKAFTPLLAGMVNTDSAGNLETWEQDFWDGSTMNQIRNNVQDVIADRQIVAQNAGFEQAVLDWMGLEYPSSRFVDSAVVARVAGAGSHLEAAAPQLLNVDKMEQGLNLIKLFSVPGKYQEANGDSRFDPAIIKDNPVEWTTFGTYCTLDAELGWRIAEKYLGWCTPQEMRYQQITMEMNRRGWPVDIELVEVMNQQYLENMEQAEFAFMTAYPDSDINLNSLKQMKEWCLKRGIRATSFDEKHVASLLERIEKKLNSGTLPPDKFDAYSEVVHLLRTKQVLGGSSLKKLKVIIDTASTDGFNTARLYDQYVHCGAGQTLRTSGRSVQMQNLKRLGGDHADVTELLEDDTTVWDNGQMAENLRQVFCSSDPNGRLIVGDFKSVESRGLAYLAGEAWKLDAYRAGRGVYEELGQTMGQDRTFGKVGELSCGYGAGSSAVQSFAEKMGVALTEGEASSLVYGWRDACPRTTDLWEKLGQALLEVVNTGSMQKLVVGGGLALHFYQAQTPDSLMIQTRGKRVNTIAMSLYSQGRVVLTRYFHGCYTRGRNVAYFKPSDRKTGDLWKDTFKDPKTGQMRYYELYGGKLAGILTQSLCREVFFHVLGVVDDWLRGESRVLSTSLVGQFHDEIVLDWTPGSTYGHRQVSDHLRYLMSRSAPWLPGFPLDADVKSAYRYIK